MKKVIILMLLPCIFSREVKAQDSIKYSIILIGDAGEINPAQKAVISDAVNHSEAGKVSVVFLGDNIYSNGMGLDSGEHFLNTADILKSQYLPFRNAGIPVYFVPGNHDWDRSGVNGYDKMIRVNEFINDQHDSLLQIIPKDACPGPYEIQLTDDIVLVAMDSEWWLFPYDKYAEKSNCECKTKQDVLAKLQDIVERNSHKIIFFATHHPFKSYGSHGGYYSIKEHIFPLTDLKKNLYIPLPVIGSLYPLLRKAFPPAQDLNNILYKNLRSSVEAILSKHPNVLHVSGHEHTLQLIQGALLQVVSGAGSKNTPVKKGLGSLFAKSASGYVRADLMLDNTVRLSFMSYDRGHIINSFIYNKSYTIVKDSLESSSTKQFNDSITVSLPGDYENVSFFLRNYFRKN